MRRPWVAPLTGEGWSAIVRSPESGRLLFEARPGFTHADASAWSEGDGRRGHGGLAAGFRPVHPGQAAPESQERRQVVLKGPSVRTTMFVLAAVAGLPGLALAQDAPEAASLWTTDVAVDTLWVLTTGIAVVFAFDFIVKSLRGHYVDTAGRRADVALSSRIFDHVLDIQMAARPQSAGGFANTLREFESVRDFFTSATVAALVDLPFLFLFIAVIWMIGGSIALVPAIAVPAVIAVGLLVQIPLGRAVRAAFGQAVARHGVLFETSGGLETIKSVGADSRMRHLWEVSVSQSARTSARSRALSLMAINFTGFAQQVAGVGIVIYGVFLIGAGALSVGALIACVILNGRAVASLAQIAQLLVRWHQARTSLFDRGVRRGGSVLVVTRYRRPGHHRPGPGDSHQPGAGRAKPRGRDSARHPRRRGRHRRTRPGPASHRRHQLRGELSRKPGPLLQHACGDRAP